MDILSYNASIVSYDCKVSIGLNSHHTKNARTQHIIKDIKKGRTILVAPDKASAFEQMTQMGYKRVGDYQGDATMPIWERR